MYLETACDIWVSVKQTYGEKCNSSRIFDLTSNVGPQARHSIFWLIITQQKPLFGSNLTSLMMTHLTVTIAYHWVISIITKHYYQVH